MNGARRYGEPGVFMSFEESVEDLTLNFASLGFDPRPLAARKQARAGLRPRRAQRDPGDRRVRSGRPVHPPRARDRLDRRQARRPRHHRNALLRIVRHAHCCAPSCGGCSTGCRTKGVTAIVTGERGNGGLTRHGLEEYITDCVILLDHRVVEQNATRRLRVVKYRGSTHGANESPFFIDESGISVLPITSLGLQHRGSTGRLSTGIAGPRRDAGRQGLLPREQHSRLRQRGHGKDQPGRLLRGRRLPSGRVRLCTSRSRSRPRRSCATCGRSASISSPGCGTDCCRSTRSARRPAVWRGTSARCTGLIEDVAAAGRRRRPDQQPDLGRHVDRGQGHARAADRFHEGAGR